MKVESLQLLHFSIVLGMDDYTLPRGWTTLQFDPLWPVDFAPVLRLPRQTNFIFQNWVRNRIEHWTMELHLLSLPPTTGTPGISLLDIIFVSADDPNRNSTLSPQWFCFGAWEVIVFDDSQSTLICTKWALLLALPSHLSILNIYIWHWDVRLVNTVKTTTPYLTSSTKPLHYASHCLLRPSATKISLFSNSKVSSLHQIISCYTLWFPKILRVFTNYSAVLSNQLQHLSNSSSSVEARDAYRNNCQWVIIMIFKIISHCLPSNCWNSGSFMGNTSVLMRSVEAFGQSITSYFWRISHGTSSTLDELKTVLPGRSLKKLSSFTRLLTPQLIQVDGYCPILKNMVLVIWMAMSQWRVSFFGLYFFFLLTVIY